MKIIRLEPLILGEEEKIAIRFPYDPELIRFVKNYPGVRWNPFDHCWNIRYSNKVLMSLRRYLEQQAEIDYSAFRKPRRANKAPKLFHLNPIHQDKLLKFRSWLRQKRYSNRTIENYSNMAGVFLNYFNDMSPEDINHEDIIHFNDDFIVGNNYSITYQRQMVSALKHFFRQVEKRQIDPEKLERPRKERKLPMVFSKEEIQAILQSIRNLKHRAILSVIYSAGLRINELVNLRVSDIDSDRMIIHIRQAKGRKDRIVRLSEKIVRLLRAYYQAYKPKNYIFEGADNSAYSASSCRSILKQAMKRANIKKRASLHTLRHSYATHLLENGTDIRYIQALLGHKNSKTTEIYTHISKKHLEDIKSPFDELDIE